jgi:hypothetical protein
MASGLVCRTNRPNTWLHRQATQREDSPCQLGAVHTWHKADLPTVTFDVRLWGTSRHCAPVTFGLLMTHLGHSRALGPDDPTRDPQQLANPQKKIANQSIVNLRPLEIYRMTGLGHLLDLCVRHHWSERLR